MTPPPQADVLDAPVTTIQYDADESRPLQDIPTTEFKARWEQVALAIFIVVPLLAVGAAGFVVWGHGLSITDVVLSVVFYVITLHGITVGFHRYFTHGSFKANRPLRIALAVAGSLAIEGPVTRWVADHRRHHAFSDREGDPHSPWRYGKTIPALAGTYLTTDYCSGSIWAIRLASRPAEGAMLVHSSTQTSTSVTAGAKPVSPRSPIS